MYDLDKAKQLQKQSHVRGMLSKQFFSGEQSQLQKKRKQMKRILDEQVQQRKRVKQKQKAQLQKKQRRQEEQIKKYYEDVIERDRRLSENSSNVVHQKNSYTDVNSNSQNQSMVRKHYQQSLKQRANSKAALQDVDNGDIPLMPVMAMSDGQINLNNNYASNSTQRNNNNYYNSNFDRQNAGNVPLLDLTDEGYFSKSKKKSKTQFKRQKTERDANITNSNDAQAGINTTKINDSRNNYQYHQTLSNNVLQAQNSASLQSNKKNERRKTLSDQDNNSIVQQNIINSRMSKVSKFQENLINRSPSSTKRNAEMQIPQEIEQIQNENKLLKSQLKKSQQAISLLIGAVRSNAKLDKFRIQAERILHNSENQSKVNQNYEFKLNEKRQQSPLLLPKLKIKHQSIMHDYLLQAAKKARFKHLKSQGSKY